MNRFCISNGKHEGRVGKHLMAKGEKAMQINDADVAELVDARDLKAFAPADNPQHSWKTPAIAPVETAANPARLENNSFQNYCNCGGYPWDLNGRPKAQPHMQWCPQFQEYADWIRRGKKLPHEGAASGTTWGCAYSPSGMCNQTQCWGGKCVLKKQG